MLKIKALGEFGLIRQLTSNLEFRAADSIQSIGDDCAVYPVNPGTNEVISTDALVEDIHFKLSTTTPEALGRKALSVSLSDIAAMGACSKKSAGYLRNSKKDFSVVPRQALFRL